MFSDFYHCFARIVIRKQSMCVWYCYCLFPSRSADGRTLSPVTCVERDTAQREQTIWGICQDLTDSKQRRVRMAGSRERGNREPSAPIAACRLRRVLRSERLRDVCLRARESPGGCETQSTSIMQTETEPRREKQAAEGDKGKWWKIHLCTCNKAYLNVCLFLHEGRNIWKNSDSIHTYQYI